VEPGEPDTPEMVDTVVLAEDCAAASVVATRRMP
jgi:hypothetical protein